MSLQYMTGFLNQVNYSGIKRYESELLAALIFCEPNIKCNITYRRCGWTGNFVFSWFSTYKPKQANILHATYQCIAPFGFLWGFKRLVVTVHDIIPIHYPENINNVSERIQWFFVPKALKRVNHIIAISKHVKNDLIKTLGIDEGKITVIYHGINRELFHPMGQKESREILNLPENKYLVLVVSSNSKHKRPNLLKSIIKEVRTRENNCFLLKAGYGQSIIDDGIINIPVVPDHKLKYLYSASDMFLHIAEDEGFGFPVLEAMACGKSIIASNRASLPEIVGDSGCLITSDKVEDYAATIINIIHDSKFRKEMENKAIKRSKEFSWEDCARRTLDVYLSLK